MQSAKQGTQRDPVFDDMQIIFFHWDKCLINFSESNIIGVDFVMV